MTTSFTNDLVLAFAGYAHGVGTAGTNFAAIHDQAGGFGEYYCKTNPGAITPTVTSSSLTGETYGIISVAFRHQ